MSLDLDLLLANLYSRVYECCRHHERMRADQAHERACQALRALAPHVNLSLSRDPENEQQQDRISENT